MVNLTMIIILWWMILAKEHNQCQAIMTKMINQKRQRNFKKEKGRHSCSKMSLEKYDWLDPKAEPNKNTQ